MNWSAWRPHGLALLDYLAGDRDARVRVLGEDGEEEWVEASVFFRGPADFSALEDAALELCRGRVLDVGGGAGSHALVLQARGLEVVAIDVVPEAVEVMRRRGVRDPRCADIFGFEGERFDTLLLMMNGIGIMGSLAKLGPFLTDIRRLLLPGGQVLCDSYDMVDGEGAVKDPNGRYPGELRFQLEYLGRRAPAYGWLFVDFPTLRDTARRYGWAAEAIWQEAEGHYLARLTPNE